MSFPEERRKIDVAFFDVTFLLKKKSNQKKTSHKIGLVDISLEITCIVIYNLLNF